MAVNTGTTWKKVQKQTPPSEHEIWSAAVQRGNIKRPCNAGRKPILPGTHSCVCTELGLPVDRALFILVQMCKDHKNTRAFCCVCFSEHSSGLIPSALCAFNPQPLPLKWKSSTLLRHGLILKRYTENSSLQWFRNQTGRSVFTGALTEQLGKGQCQICICFLSPAAVFFLCQECKASHWLCSWCQCVCTEGQGREKAEKRRRRLHNNSNGSLLDLGISALPGFTLH